MQTIFFFLIFRLFLINILLLCRPSLFFASLFPLRLATFAILVIIRAAHMIIPFIFSVSNILWDFISLRIFYFAMSTNIKCLLPFHVLPKSDLFHSCLVWFPTCTCICMFLILASVFTCLFFQTVSLRPTILLVSPVSLRTSFFKLAQLAKFMPNK